MREALNFPQTSECEQLVETYLKISAAVITAYESTSLLLCF